MTEPSPERTRKTVLPATQRMEKVLPGTKETVPVLTDDLIRRYGGRLLDPDTAAQPVARRALGPDQFAPTVSYLPTAYVADEILVDVDLLPVLGLDPDPARLTPQNTRFADTAQLRRRTPAARDTVARYQVISTDDRPADAWRTVQAARDLLVGRPVPDDDQDAAPRAGRVEQAKRIGLNHLMQGAGVTGEGFKKPIGTGSGGSGADYSTPGWGGRGPVALTYPPPARTSVGRRPVVAIVDSGVADHPWFRADPAGPVLTRLHLSGGVLVPESGTGGQEIEPNLIDPLELEIDPFFGHGTFIAGLVRQHCPDANLLSIQIMKSDGIVLESDLLDVLDGLLARQRAAQAPKGPIEEAVDVVSLSMGFYPEEPDTPGYAGLLQDRLDALRSLGVTVVAAAGNDSTTLPFLPAALSSYQNGSFVLPPVVSALVASTTPTDPADWSPMISVGALNPSQSVALFSNDGSWIACRAPGALLVSTTPDVDASGQPGRARDDAGATTRTPGDWRSSIDPDLFTGWGTWSGTSFAAPIVAGCIVEQLVHPPAVAGVTAKQPLDDVAAPSMCSRAAAAAQALGLPAPAP